jgi:hypothetical protein
MVRKVLFAILIGVILTSGWAYATVASVCEKEEAKAENRHVVTAKVVDETYGVRGNEVHQFNAERTPWVRHGSKAVTIDTIAWFSAEGPSWQDEMMAPAEWDTIDGTCFPDSDAHGWDGYQVRVSTDYPDFADATYFEIKPYKVTDDSSYYTHAMYGEWDSLYAMEQHESTGGGFGTDAELACSAKIFDLRAFEGERISIRFIFASDPAFCTSDADSLFGLILDDILVVEGMDSLTLATLPAPLGGDTLFFENGQSMPHQMIPTAPSTWHVDDFNACSGDSAWWVGDPSVGSQGGYLDDKWEELNAPAYDIAIGDSTFLVYYQWLKCEPGNQATCVGSYWWLAFGGQSGAYKAHNGDPYTEKYASGLEDMLASPKIAHADLNANLADLWVKYYYKGNFNDLDAFPNVDYINNEYRVDGGEWQCVSLLFGTTCWVLPISDNSDWYFMDSDNMCNLSALITDPEHNVWDTLQVAVRVHTDLDTCEDGGVGLQVDNVTISGRIGFPNDIGVVAAKIPSPNANGVKLFMDTLAVENYGFNTASSGAYMVKMTIVDSNGTVVFGPGTQIAAFATPQIDPLQTVLVPLDTSVCNFTLTEEGVYDFFIWTEWSTITDDDPSNDTLRTETAKGFYYPYAFNYPAGQGQLRYHDQGFYTDGVWRRTMDANEIAAVHFQPDPSFYPFDVRLALPVMTEVGETYNFKAYGPGVDDDHPGAEWLSVPFTTANDSLTGYVRLEMDVMDPTGVLEHLSTDFWLGVEFPSGTGGEYIMGLEADDPVVGGQWDHSYQLEYRPPPFQSTWVKTDVDWFFTCVISWRTVDAAAMVSESGPPMKNSSGNLYLDWDDVSQAQEYLIYRTTDVTGSFPLWDSTAVSNYTDADVVGTVGTNYYYLFHTRHQDGGVYDKTSKAVGEFDKTMLNAK